VLYGAPGEIRTPDPQIRSLVLYPAELRARRARCAGRCSGPRLGVTAWGPDRGLAIAFDLHWQGWHQAAQRRRERQAHRARGMRQSELEPMRLNGNWSGRHSKEPLERRKVQSVVQIAAEALMQAQGMAHRALLRARLNMQRFCLPGGAFAFRTKRKQGGYDRFKERKQRGRFGTRCISRSKTRQSFCKTNPRSAARSRGPRYGARQSGRGVLIQIVALQTFASCPGRPARRLPGGTNPRSAPRRGAGTFGRTNPRPPWL
jgi:hypothetical protein